jgi:hypothetical protein
MIEMLLKCELVSKSLEMKLKERYFRNQSFSVLSILNANLKKKVTGRTVSGLWYAL